MPPPCLASTHRAIRIIVTNLLANISQPASRFFEACGALDDPKYHTPEDDYPREGYGDDDYDIDGTLKEITKGMLATAWTLLTPSIE